MFAHLSALKQWAIPPFHQKELWTASNSWIIGAPLPFLLLQIHLLLRYDPKVTLPMRASLIPIVVLLSLRTGFSHYLKFQGEGQLDGGAQHFNMTIGMVAIFYIACSLRCGFKSQKPRLKVAKNYNRSNGNHVNGHCKHGSIRTGSAQYDEDSPLPVFFPGSWTPCEIDYFINLRGLGWEHGMKEASPAIPVRRFSPSYRLRWVLFRLGLLSVHFVLIEIIFAFIKEPRFNPTVRSPYGGSVWECTQGSFGMAGPYLLCLIYAFGMYTNIQADYLMASLVAVGLLQDLPSRWEPLPLHKPFLATSLRQMWSYRWHQLFRSTFLDIGYYPTTRVLGPLLGKTAAKMAGVIAVFTVSGLMHDFGQAAMTSDQGLKLTGTTAFFVSQGLGTVAEAVWERLIGRQVRGVVGWIWTMCFMLLTAPLVVDEFNKRCFLGSIDFTIGFTKPWVDTFLDSWDALILSRKA